MTNKEFYSEKLLAAALTRNDGCKLVYELKHGKSCYGLPCFDCELYTIEGMCEWLNAEHKEPPLLENGDGLNPGDWIMVRDVDSQSFVRRQFLYFFDGKFICSSPNHAPLEGFGEPWVQALLPENGE